MGASLTWRIRKGKGGIRYHEIQKKGGGGLPLPENSFAEDKLFSEENQKILGIKCNCPTVVLQCNKQYESFIYVHHLFSNTLCIYMRQSFDSDSYVHTCLNLSFHKAGLDLG